MRRDDTIRFLREHQDVIRAFGVSSLSLFGSVARDEARDDSDVDILVEFANDPTYDEYCSLRFWLEDSLDAKVDLVLSSGLRDRARPYVESDAIRVA